MTSTIDTRGTALVPAAGRIGQATAVEQSRAVAEVHAAIVVAQQCPRNIASAVADMQRSCAQKSLAEKAFFRYSRGGSQISGASVQLARELARCWGNIQYGLTELRRDDTYRQSEMQAWAWDVQTNARSSTTFIVPHARDRDGKVVELTALRDLYENNANNGARRLREMVFAILPGWYTEDAITACYETLAGDDETLPQRIEQCVAGFGKLGVTMAHLAQKLGAPRERWTAYDLATLTVVYRSLTRGETTREEEFGTVAAIVRPSAADLKPAGGGKQEGTPPAPAVTDLKGGGADRPTGAVSAAASEAAPGAAAPAQTAPSGAPDPAAPASPAEPAAAPKRKPVTKTTLGKLQGALLALPLGTSDERPLVLSALAGREVKAPHDLGQVEAEGVLAVIDGELEAAQGDTEEAASAIWRRVNAVKAADVAREGEPDA